MTILTCDNQCI